MAQMYKPLMGPCVALFILSMAGGSVADVQQRNATAPATNATPEGSGDAPCARVNFTVAQVQTAIWWRCDVSTPEGGGSTPGFVQVHTCSSAAYCANTYRTVKVSPECVTVLRRAPHLSDPRWTGHSLQFRDRAGVAVCGTVGGPVAAIEYFFVYSRTSNERRIAFSLHEVDPSDLIRLIPPPHPGTWYTREEFKLQFRVPFYGFAGRPKAAFYVNGTLQFEWNHFATEAPDDAWSQTVNIFFGNHGLGTYRIDCLAAVWNTTEIANHSTTFEVRQSVSPYFEQAAEVVNLEEGVADQKLTCDAHGDPTPFKYAWAGHQESMERFGWGDDESPAGGNALVIASVSRLLNRRLVICVAKNRFGESATKEFRILVVEPRARAATGGANDTTKGEGVPPPVSTATIAATGTVSTVIVATLSLTLRFVCCKYYKLHKTVKALLTDDEVREFLEGRALALSFGGNNGNFERDAEKDPVTIECMPYNSDFEVEKERFFVDFSRMLGSGQYGVVYKGLIKSAPEVQEIETRPIEQDVAVKTVRPNVTVEYFKALLSELKILAYIGSHDNIAGLVGACSSNIKNLELYVGVELCAGSLLQFLHKNRDKLSNYVEPASVNLPAETSFNEYENARLPDAVTDSDLTRWAAEIAAGMEFLTQRRVVHGDLAARNVLLSFEFRAKICDFGLARQLIDYTYTKATECKLPWKWMAPESLAQMHFSIASDVWAYGVTCWEIFTLGDVPYPCMAWSWDFIAQLEAGQRLPRPKYASVAIYDLMLECWHREKENRPNFRAIGMFFESEKGRSE